jgi:hypothetical protein
LPPQKSAPLAWRARELRLNPEIGRRHAVTLRDRTITLSYFSKRFTERKTVPLGAVHGKGFGPTTQGSFAMLGTFLNQASQQLATVVSELGTLLQGVL